MRENPRDRATESPARLTANDRRNEATTHVRFAALTAVRLLLVLGAVSVADAQDTPEKKGDTKSLSAQSEREQWKENRISATLESLRRSVRKLDDDLFAVRQEGSSEIVETINGLLSEINPPPPAIMEIFENLHPKTKAGELSLEQRTRLTYIGEHVRTSIAEKPDRIPPLEYEWRKCLELIGEQTGFTIDVSEVDGNVLDGMVSVRSGENACFTLLRKFCATADLAPEFGMEHGVIHFRKRKEGTVEHMIDSGKLLAITTKNPEGQESINVRMSPRAGALVSIKNVKSGEKAASVVSIGDHGIPAWKFSDVGSLPSRSETTNLSPAAPWISAECAVAQQAKTVRLTKDAAGGEIGFQKFRVLAPDPEQPTRLQVNAWVFADVPWPATPCDIDSKTYGAGAASTFRPVDAGGKRIPARVVSCEVQQRLMIFTLECESAPAAVDITAYRDLVLEQKIEMEMP